MEGIYHIDTHKPLVPALTERNDFVRALFNYWDGSMAKKQKILSIAGGEELGSDAERIARLRNAMTPSERDTYDKVMQAIAISLESGRLSGFPQLIAIKQTLEAKYETDADDTVRIGWDDEALNEAVGSA